LNLSLIPSKLLVCPLSPSSCVARLIFIVTKEAKKEVEEEEEETKEVENKTPKTGEVNEETDKNKNTKIKEPAKETDKIGCTMAEVIHFFEVQKYLGQSSCLCLCRQLSYRQKLNISDHWKQDKVVNTTDAV
jgi:hypothetical protein